MMKTKPHILGLLFVLLILTGRVHADHRLVEVNFEVKEARYSESGEYLGEVPIEDVKIRIRPDRWADGPRSRPGVSKKTGNDGLSASVKGLVIDIPNSQRHGRAEGHLELIGRQPWGTEEKYLLWRHGYGNGKHDKPFAVDTHQPQKVILIPVEHSEHYYRTRIQSFTDSVSSRSYFASLVDGMIGPELTPEGQSPAVEFAPQRDKVIQEAAAFWNVSSDDITSGFSRWQNVVAESPSSTEPQEKALAIAYSEGLTQAAEATRLLVHASPASDVAENVWLDARVNIALGRDILAKEGGRFPASGSREERLTKALKAFQDASTGIDKLNAPGLSESPIDDETKQSLDKILENWTTPLTPPPNSMKVFTMPVAE